MPKSFRRVVHQVQVFSFKLRAAIRDVPDPATRRDLVRMDDTDTSFPVYCERADNDPEEPANV